MSGVYIKDMEMPVFEHQSWDIRRGTDGKWYVTDTNAETSDGEWHELVPVPPHGRLGDLDKLVDRLTDMMQGAREENPPDDTFTNGIICGLKAAISEIRYYAPTIIPADPAEERERVMKAYHVRVVDGEYATIVFAESVKEAKKLAMGTECCEDAAYIDIRVRREPTADQLYDGERREIDWYNFETRKFLMENLNWSCYEPSWECDGCSLKPYCSWWEEED